jgi:hypothetical protein
MINHFPLLSYGMGDIRKGLLAGLISGIIIGAFLTLVEYVCMVVLKEYYLEFMRISISMNPDIPITAEAMYELTLTLLPVGVLFPSLLGIVFGVIYAVVYEKIPTESIRLKGLFIGALYLVVLFALFYPRDYSPLWIITLKNVLFCLLYGLLLSLIYTKLTNKDLIQKS